LPGYVLNVCSSVIAIPGEFLYNCGSEN